MAEGSESLYEKHKKYHDLATRVRELFEEEVISSHYQNARNAADAVWKKYESGGIVDFSKIDESEIDKEFGKIWDTYASDVAKNYLKMDDDEIKKFKGKKTNAGGSVWEHMMGRYLGITKQQFLDRIKTRGTVNVQEKDKLLADQLADAHIQYRANEILQENLTKLDDIKGVSSYVRLLKKHHKKKFRKISGRDYKDLQEAIQVLSNVANEIPENYHPDNPETYTS